MRFLNLPLCFFPTRLININDIPFTLFAFVGGGLSQPIYDYFGGESMSLTMSNPVTGWKRVRLI